MTIPPEVKMHIQVLGTGCTKCSRLAKNADRAAQECNIPYVLEKVADIAQIIDFGVMTTPALLINGQCCCSGTVPSVDEIKAMIQKAENS
jgi:small redox-active disulfide protein 2